MWNTVFLGDDGQDSMAMGWRNFEPCGSGRREAQKREANFSLAWAVFACLGLLS